LPIGPGAAQLHLAELDLYAVHRFRRHGPIFGKQTQRGVVLPLFVEHLQRLPPGGLLGVVDLAQIQHPALHHSAGLQPAALLDAEVAVLLAVLDAPVAPQKHRLQQNARSRDT
jgi:hypothetical protein